MQAQLERIYDRLGGPSARQLRVAALREGLEVNTKQVSDFVARKADAQLFQQPQGSDMTTATRGPKSDFQADLIDLKQFGGNSKVILIVCNPWNRKLAMEQLPNKTPAAVTVGFRSILNRMDKPDVISTDQDQAFKGPFNAMLEEKGILHRYNDPRNRNTLAVLDRALQTVKTTLFMKMTRRNTMQWDKFVKEVEDGYNETVHGHLLGSPNDTEGDSKTAKINQFDLQQKNAEAFEANHDKAEKRMEAVREAGAFREANKQETFTRGFKPQLGPVRQVREVKAGQIVDTEGKRVPMNAVKPVPADTEETAIPSFRGRGLRDDRLKEDLKEFAKDLYDALDQEMALTAAARLMPAEFSRAKPTTLLFSQFLQLYPNLFKVTGEGPAKRVRRIRKRAIGKQPDRR